MILSEFIPLDYYKVEAGVPLLLDIGYICKIEIKQLSIYSLVSIDSIVSYSTGKIKILLENSEKIAGKANALFSSTINKGIYSGYMTLIEMIYSLTEDNFKKKRDKLKYHKFLIKYLIKDVEKLHYVIEKIIVR